MKTQPRIHDYRKCSQTESNRIYLLTGVTLGRQALFSHFDLARSVISVLGCGLGVS